MKFSAKAGLLIIGSVLFFAAGCTSTNAPPALNNDAGNNSPARNKQAQDGCKIGGCSGELCGEKSESLISTCEIKSETGQDLGICRRLSDGKCGWSKE